MLFEKETVFLWAHVGFVTGLPPSLTTSPSQRHAHDRGQLEAMLQKAHECDLQGAVLPG